MRHCAGVENSYGIRDYLYKAGIKLAKGLRLSLNSMADSFKVHSYNTLHANYQYSAQSIISNLHLTLPVHEVKHVSDRRSINGAGFGTCPR